MCVFNSSENFTSKVWCGRNLLNLRSQQLSFFLHRMSDYPPKKQHFLVISRRQDEILTPYYCKTLTRDCRCLFKQKVILAGLKMHDIHISMRQQ